MSTGSCRVISASLRTYVSAALATAFVCVVIPASGQEPQPERSDYVVSGTVRDSAGVLPGAEVRLVEVNRVARTDGDGRFHVAGVPAGRVTLAVHLQGFTGLRRSVTVPLASELDLRLDADLRFSEEVVVSAAPWALTPLETAQQTDVVKSADVQRQQVASVGEALARVPGVTYIPTGNALGTPVIRGLSEHRIRILNDGIGLNHQQFSWRHSPNVEPGFSERLELVRGPASVLYGSDAIGGVINLIHAPLPRAAEGGRLFHGAFTTGFSSNTAEWSGQGRLEGALGGFGWRGDVLRREGGDIATPRGILHNTDFAQTNATIMAGYGGTWGSARARWHHWENDTGFYRPLGFRLGLDDDLMAGDVHLATRAGAVELLAAWQRNSRQALEIPEAPATLDLKLDTLTFRTALQHRQLGMLRGQVALEYQGVDNKALVGTLVPDYRTDSYAVMLFEEARLWPVGSARYHRLTLSAGVRGDAQSLDVTRATGRSTADYGATTGSLGAVLRLHDTLAVAASLGRGWRPPSAFELYAYGVHGGVAAFQVGNTDLTEESNVNAELSLRYQGRLAHASLTTYRNAFSHYIYLADSDASRDALPIFVYRQADATFRGLEAALALTPVPWTKLDVAWTRMSTRNELTGNRLPQTPANRLVASASLSRPSWGPLRNLSLGLDATFVGAAGVSGPDEPLGTSTHAYELVDLRTAAGVPAGRTTLELALTVRNLLNREYTDFLWSYKPFAPNPGRDVRLSATWRF